MAEQQTGAQHKAETAVCTREYVWAQGPHQSSDCQEVTAEHTSEKDLEKSVI